MRGGKEFRLTARGVTAGGGALFLLFGLLYLFLGQHNTDEGWYLYASRLVYQGKLPYRDFAFTQTPLLPYLYGLPQRLIASGLETGRAFSLLLALAALGLGIRLARRQAGPPAAAAAALLSASFTMGIYFLVIVKTYALLTFLFIAAFALLCLDERRGWKYPLAASVAFLSVLTRLSALCFWLPVAAYCLWMTRASKSRFLSVLASALLLPAAAAVLFDFGSEAARWNLFTYHMLHWGGIDAGARLTDILFHRLPDLVGAYGIPLLFIIPLAVTELRRRPAPERAAPAPLLPVAVGLLLFAASHLAAGSWHSEYLIPAFMAAFPLAAIGWARSLAAPGAGPETRRLLRSALAAAALFSLVGHNLGHVDLSGGRPPLQEIRQVSQTIDRLTRPGDKVLALEALSALVASRREALPGLSMAQFSFWNTDDETVRKLGLVNGRSLVRAIDAGSARLVLLTDFDRSMLRRSGDEEAIGKALARRYRRHSVVDDFGQYGGRLYIFVCRD